MALSLAMSGLVSASRKARTSLFCALNLTTLFSIDPSLASAHILPANVIVCTSSQNTMENSPTEPANFESIKDEAVSSKVISVSVSSTSSSHSANNCCSLTNSGHQVAPVVLPNTTNHLSESQEAV